MDDTSIGGHDPEGGAGPQRRDQRDSLFMLARIKHEGQTGEGVSVRVRNVSTGGLMADVAGDYHQGARVEVVLEGIGTMNGAVAWAEAGRIGIAFDHPIDKTRARKTVAGGDRDIFRPIRQDYRRPGLKPDTRR